MATIRDVAERAGVCVATVSRTLNQKSSVRPETRERVLAAMRELNYYPNEIARSLSTNRSHLIGIIAPMVDHPFFCILIQAIELACFQLDYKLLLCTSRGDAAKEHEMTSMLRSNKVDGVILAGSLVDPSAYSHYELPMVSVEHKIDNVPSVSCDNYRGGVMAADVLLRSGCRRPVVISTQPNEQLPSFLRITGFRDECERRGVDFIHHILPGQAPDGDYSGVVSELRRLGADGVFTTRDTGAARIIRLCAREGILTPPRPQGRRL